ncbi:MAG TPA: hypothetical protein VGP82_09600 [Ktedonobacterales bacterium]|jgi:hypothetical protein|nr:hypothetical protein [Ktedonobacterales bacterium]
MWNERLAALISDYPTGVLSTVEPSGYPASIRCAVAVHAAEQTITFPNLPAFAASWRGKAALLFHRHNARLEGLHQLVIKGELVQVNSVVTFKVNEFVTGTGRQDTDAMPHAGAPIQMLQFFLLGRRKARAYIAKRGAPWPPIPFHELDAEFES